MKFVDKKKMIGWDVCDREAFCVVGLEIPFIIACPITKPKNTNKMKNGMSFLC